MIVIETVAFGTTLTKFLHDTSNETVERPPTPFSVPEDEFEPKEAL